MSSSPLVEEINLLSFDILSAGSEIPNTYQVLEIRVEQYVNKISETEIILRDGSTANQTFDVSDADTFKPGTDIEIKLGYESKNDSVFKGVVTKQIIKVDEEGSKLHVVCKDEALKLSINRKNGIFTKIKDSDLIEKIAGDYSLSNAVTATTLEHKEIIQYYVTDWDFIMSRAEVNGMIVVTDSGKLTVAKPAVSDTPALQVQYGYDIIEFDGELDATFQYSGVEGNAWDMSTQKVINATASEPTVNEQGNITGSKLADVLTAGTKSLNSSVPVVQGDIQAWADGALLKSRLSRFKGNVVFQGSAKAKVNSTIKLMGLGERFNGNAFISGVVHTVGNGKWHTEVKIGLSAEWFVEKNMVSAPLASGLLPGVEGLQTGIVKKINEDPDNEFRVEVEIPILGDDSDTVWARLSTFYAGDSFGAYFMPEIDDEVILGFMNNDPRFPIILGSVFSSKIPAPETPDEDNSIKTLITKNKLKLEFDDKNKVITILTPGGNTMVFTDKDKGITVTDENENEIKMNSDGITITDKSKNEIEMASGGITITSKSDLTLKASQDVSIKGASITIDGDQSTTVKGSSTCEVSSSGETSVKGSTVMIN